MKRRKPPEDMPPAPAGGMEPEVYGARKESS
jgi:hypothetical protein